MIYIKNMGKPEMIEQLSADDRFQVLNTDTVLLLNEVMNAGFQVQREDKVTDMCYAIEKIKEEAAKEAAKEAAEKARIATLADNINKLKDAMGWTSEKTMEILKLSENDRRATAPFL